MYEYEAFLSYISNIKDIDLKTNFKNDDEYLNLIKGVSNL
ncbi:hypothetical protein I3900191A7_25140 [Clostridium baratii]